MGESLVVALARIEPRFHKGSLAEGEQWYVRLNGGAWFGVKWNWNLVKDDGVWCERDGFLGLTSATSAF